MHNIKHNFDKIFPIVKDSLKNIIDSDGNIKKAGAKPKFSDLELITLSLVAESLSIDSENFLFVKLKSEYKNDFPNIIDRSQYNKRRRKLSLIIERVRKYILKRLLPQENVFIIDSMPIEICKFVRAKRIKICKENINTSPEFGYCASHNTHFYGYKLHSVCSLNGIITSFDLSKANVYDNKYIKDIEHQYSNCLILGDKAYLDYEYQLDLFQHRNIQLETPKRTNQHNFKKQPWFIKKSRKRIETIFSQLTDHFQIKRNYAKSFAGFMTRILSKITAFTILQFINKLNNKNINNVKHALA